MEAATARWRDRGYTLETIRERLGIGDHRQNQTPRLADRLGAIAAAWDAAPPDDAAGVLIQLLILNNPVARGVASRTLGDAELADLTEMQIVRLEGDLFRPALTISEWDGLYFASDTMWRRREGDSFGAGPMPDDLVLNPVFDSFEFASTVVTRPARRALDLCTGCGVVALHASRTHDEVVAVDNQARSVAFVRFNAGLNRIDNVRAVQGDMYSGVPAAGPAGVNTSVDPEAEVAASGRFDTITANPPYMPCDDSKPGDNFYCGGPQGDALTNVVLEGLDHYLQVGGVAHLVGFLICREDRVAAGTTSPDLATWCARGYDVVLETYPVPMGDPRVISAIANFGAETRRLEYGAYSLRRRASGLGTIRRSTR